MRGDRYVIPVKAEYKGAVPGLVHDQSSTGATLFIEPMSLVNLNNEIKELMLKEKAEIERILSELSARVYENFEEANNNYKILTELDFIFAKGKYASKLNAIIPAVRDDRSFDIIGGKHPLIDPKVVVPSDIYLGEEFTTLMITGPNTGGKTVTLKTVGLLHLMALSGLLIPARDGSAVAFFNEIFADIGDEQSIEQSLSTFSSHMTNIVSILEEADKDSLVLFDELGSGTDPTEGAALAVAVIETLKNRGARLIATTHYSELKGYALRTAGVENSSVEFDVETLKPTYRLLIGIPGKSNAFEISKRLGLGGDVIAKAKDYMSKENLQFEDLIRDLQEKSIIANKDAREAKRIKEEADELKKKYEEKLQKLDKVRDKAYEEARREAKEIISRAKDEADEIVKAMRELEKMGIAEGGRNRLEAERRKLKESLEEKEAAMLKIRENNGEPIKKVTLGMEAFLPSLNQRVIIISMPDNKGEVQVEAGIMKINVKLKDLRKVEVTPVKKEKKKRELKLNLKSVESRIDLRGMDAEEACYRTDKYLDEAYMANLGEVTVVHGKGTGILRKAISDMLKKHPHVKSYRLGVYGEGGDGVTIVELK
ncbi:endonuclease MutS2, partial [Clostridium saudiense]|nr:endonuclease MutS2 [Clostridium saudiense]